MQKQRLTRSFVAAMALLSAATLSGTATAGDATKESHSEQQITRPGSVASLVGPSETFTGQVRVDMLWPATDGVSASGALVTFEPGARSAWHSHPFGQRLVVVTGRGLTQEWGKPIQEIFPGDVVWCPPGVKHWHGASEKTAMSHLAVSGTGQDGTNVNWMEKVSDAQYLER